MQKQNKVVTISCKWPGHIRHQSNISLDTLLLLGVTCFVLHAQPKIAAYYGNLHILADITAGQKHFVCVRVKLN